MVPSQDKLNRTANIFDSPCSSISSDRQDVVTIGVAAADDDDSDVEIDEQSSTNHPEQTAHLIVNKLLGKLDVNSEILVVKPNLPIRICTTALPYGNLSNIQIIMIHNERMLTSECVTKRQVYMNKPCSLQNLPIRTRILNRSLSLLGFILENPCQTKNHNRYLVVYDNLTASYHSDSILHVCFCQDFRRHLFNIDYQELRTYYQYIFENSEKKSYQLNTIIRVKKFGNQYHNVRIIDIDCSLIKISFFERKSKPEIWIHSNSSIIDRTTTYLPISPTSIELPRNPRLRKRKSNTETSNRKETKKFRDQINIENAHEQTLSSAARSNIVTAYYTNNLLPKFRLLNALPSTVHKCHFQCVSNVEKDFSSNQLLTNPFLLPFEYNWSIVDSKPRGYRTPCLRTLYSLDEIEQYLYQTQSKLSIKFFIDGVLTRFKPPIDDYEKQYLLMTDLSNGLENVQISVYNDLDNDRPDKFQYITNIRPIDRNISAAFNDTNMTSCCDCTDNCMDRMKCACFRKTLEQARINQDPSVIEKEKNRSTLSYMLKTTGYQRKRLLNPISSGIYECNSKCLCHRQHCSNRLVQQGLFVHLQLFKYKHKGWGLRTLHDLPRGTFICQYIGELLTSEQGNIRAETMDDKYQTSLDLVKQVRYEIDDDTIDDDDDSEPYVIDGSLYSNVGKYFNHSCDPNMFIQNVFIESHDLHFPNLALFTRTHVKAGQELTWHYNCELLPDREMKCFCGTKNCRGRLL